MTTALGELHKEWIEAGVSTSRATAHRCVQEIGAKEKNNWTVAYLLFKCFSVVDDLTTLTTTKPCAVQLLRKLQENIELACMKMKPSKSRSICIVKGKLSDHRFHIGEEPIPTVSEKPVKSLGRWYDASLRDKEQVDKLRKEVASGLENINRTLLPGKLKLWCMQYGLLPRLMWLLTRYEVPLSKVEKLESLVSSYARKGNICQMPQQYWALQQRGARSAHFQSIRGVQVQQSQTGDDATGFE